MNSARSEWITVPVKASI